MSFLTYKQFNTEDRIINNWQLNKIIPIANGHFWNDFYMAILPAILPILALKFKYTLSQLGLLVLIMSIISSVIQPFLGYLIDKSGKGYQIIFSLLWITVLMSSLGFFSSFIGIALITTLASLGCSFYHPIGSILTRNTSGDYKERAMSIFTTSGNLGYALAPVIVIPFVNWLSLKGLIYFVVPGILSIIWIKLSGVSDVQIITYKNQLSIKESFKGKVKRLLQLNLLVGVRAWSIMIISTYLPYFLVTQGFSIEFGGTMLTIFLVANTVGIFSGGWVAEVFGKEKTLVYSLIISGLCFIGFLITNGILMWIFIILSGLFMQMSFSTTIILAQDIVPNNAAMASGMMLGLSYGIGSLGVLITGIIADKVGLLPAIQSVIILLFFTAGISKIYFRSIKIEQNKSSI